MPRKDPNLRRELNNAYGLAVARKGRDITEGYPDPGDLGRREACESNFRLFCETYFPFACRLKWSDDHLKVIAKMEEVILRGGLFALAMPRGAGKSTLSTRACLWSLLYGHRRYVCLVAATEELAGRTLKAMKDELQYNDLLAADFRQVCYPIRRIENNGRRCIGQLFDGQQTRIEWGKHRVTFPTMPDFACDGANVSGHTISAVGLTGALRGQFQTLPDGTIVRPEVVILDDPQTRESAMSLTQSDTRAAIIKGDVLGMAGPDQTIAAIMPCTVVRNGDMADELLDRKKNPEWGGQRHKMVYAFPTNTQKWDEYTDIRREEFESDGDGSVSTAFYAENRAEMDAGAIVAWQERFKPGELSALQHAMNLKILDERAFHAEYQNSPLPEQEVRTDDLTPEQIMARVNNHKRGVAPIDSQRIVAFIDVQKTLLFYAVMALEDGFTGNVLSYGTFPEQNRPYFTLRDAKRTIADAIKAPDLEGQLYGALNALTADLLSREWPREDSAALKIERCLIDAGWGESTPIVKKFCRQSVFSQVLTPSHGKYIGAGSNSMAEWPKRQGERVGLNWRLRTMEGNRAVRSIIFDTNFWKSFLHNRLSVPMGSKSSMTFFGMKPAEHRLLADHLCSEFRVQVEAKSSGRVVDEWKPKLTHAENHWFDCLVGCCVAASVQGVTLDEAIAQRKPKPKRMNFEDMQKQRMNLPPL